MNDNILFLCINLRSATERRSTVEEQAQRLGIKVQFVEAVVGRELPADVPEYDRAERRKRYHYDLTPNEIACTLSHKKALQTFLDSTADYAVIMEDDALLAEDFSEGLQELIERIRGWEAAKLYTDDGGALYSLGDTGGENSHVCAVFPRKLMWVSVAWLYTRSGAQKLLEGLQTFSLATDAQIGTILLKQRIPVIGVSPSLITTSDPNNEKSTISTAESPRTAHEQKRTLLQYLRYRLSVAAISRAKKHMIALMKQRLHRV